MAEIGLVASIIGVAGAGAKLSIILFDFASTIGAAGRELQDIGIEISVLCSVLEQLEAVLSHAHFRYSTAAVKTSQRILRKCDAVFKEIDLIVKSVWSGKNDEAGAIPSVDFVSKVKWTFKRSKVQLLRSTLESCKLTLSVMLSTMQLAEKSSMRRTTVTANLALEDERDRLTMQSLIISQQWSLERLERCEDEVASEETVAAQLPDSAVQFSTSKRRRSRGRLVKMFSGLSVDTSTASTPIVPPPPPRRFERASIWLGAVVFGDELEPHPGTQVRRRLSSVDTAEAPSRLLREWTDQGTGEIVSGETPAQKMDERHLNMWRDSKFSFTNSSHSSVDDQRQSLRSAPGDFAGASVPIDISPKSPRASSISATQASLAFSTDMNEVSAETPRTSTTSAGQLSLSTNISSALALDAGSVRAMTPDLSAGDLAYIIMRSFGVSPNSAGQSSLSLAYGGSERSFGDGEKPLEAYMQYKSLGLSPRLLVCRDAAMA